MPKPSARPRLPALANAKASPTMLARRKALGLTMAALAARVGCGLGTVGRCEKANELPRNRILRRAYEAALAGGK